MVESTFHHCTRLFIVVLIYTLKKTLGKTAQYTFAYWVIRLQVCFSYINTSVSWIRVLTTCLDIRQV